MYILFKSLRKIQNLFQKVKSNFRLASLKHLSRNRMTIHDSIVMGRNFSINSDITPTWISISQEFRVRDNFNLTMGNGGKLSIGSRCFFNNGCSLNCLGAITIGNDSQFGENVLLYDHNHKFEPTNGLIAEQGYDVGQISIGNNCWIGSGVIILKDVIIGDNVVIGAGCVIHKSIPSNTMVYNQQNLVYKSLSGE